MLGHLGGKQAWIHDRDGIKKSRMKFLVIQVTSERILCLFEAFSLAAQLFLLLLVRFLRPWKARTASRRISYRRCSFRNYRLIVLLLSKLRALNLIISYIYSK